MLFNSCPDSSRPIKFHFFKKQLGIRSGVHHSFCLSLQFLSQSLITQNLCLFLGQRFKSFLTHSRVRHFYPFFLNKLHAFMHFFFIKKIQNFSIKANFGFLMILCILIKIDSWVFVHASHKHDSHALISKFLWFLQIFEIRVYVFLRDLGILLNWAKLSEIGLWYWLIEWL